MPGMFICLNLGRGELFQQQHMHFEESILAVILTRFASPPPQGFADVLLN